MITEQFQVLGLYIDVIDYRTTLRKITAWIDHKQKMIIHAVAVHNVMVYRKDAQLLRLMNASGLVVPDGMPLVWIGRLAKKKTTRVYGPTLMQHMCRIAVQYRYRVFLFGGRDGQASRLKTRLESQYPGLLVVGAVDSTGQRPTPKALTERVVTQVNKTKSDIVFVGLGCPYQEKWMISERRVIQAPILVGVGAAFDFLSGDVKQAPQWVQRIGFEWLFRLMQEPRRLLYRYTVENIQFIWLMISTFVYRPTV